MHGGLNYLFDKVIRRAPTDDEAARYGGHLAKCVRRFGNYDGIIRGLTPVFLHPEAMYRLELGGKPAGGAAMLAPLELAHAIAFALTDRAPDAALLQAAREGKLQTRDDARREVRRILSDSAIEKPRLLRFFQEYFGYVNSTTVFKDPSYLAKNKVHVKAYRPSELVEDTDLLVRDCIQQDKGILRNLLTTDRTYVASRYAGYWGLPRSLSDIKGCKKEDLFPFYDLTDAERWPSQGTIVQPKEQRAGVLTQPSWLVAFSTNDSNNAILRGKWVRERLLGGMLPDVPIGVNAALPDEPKSTLRHRMRVTREESCWKCHSRMDPLGLPFEMFDGLGSFRTQELGEPVNASGEILSSGVPELDGPVSNAIELIHKLAGAERVHQVFVRHAFRFWMGRNETRQDAAVLQQAYQDYRDRGESYQALIESLLTSDAFLLRSRQAK